MKRKFLLVFLILVMLFSVLPLAGCSKSKTEKTPIRSLDDLHRRRIGLETGVSFDNEVKEAFPDCTVDYFGSNYDLMAAVDIGKIDAFVCDEPFAMQMIREKPSYSVLEKISDDLYSYAFAKDSTHALSLCKQMDDFLDKAESDGTLEELSGIWLGEDESKKTVDLSVLTGENGTIKLGISVDGAAPFTYVKDGNFVGYEVDLAIRFCQEYGYGLDILDYEFSGLLTAVTTGRVDFGASCISVTEERKSTLAFSRPSFAGGVVVVVKKPTPVYASIEELQGKRAGVITGSVFDQTVTERVPGASVVYLNTAADLSAALSADKIDFFLTDEPIAKYLLAQHPDQSLIGSLADDHYGFIFRKNDEKGSLLCQQMNEFLVKSKTDGSLDRIVDSWLGKDAPEQSVDYDDLPAENGTLSYAISTSIGAPYAFMQNGKYAGYEVALAVGFCREYGYGIKFFDSSFEGMLSAVALGKCDFGSSGISITEERKESMLFSDPIYDGGIAVTVKNDVVTDSGKSFFRSNLESFEKTFIREARWKLFLTGIGITLLVTVLSAVLGSLAGFVFFLLYRKKIPPIVGFFDFVGDMLEKMPVVVILMILYYVIFGKNDISGIVVSVIGFSVLFSFGVLGLLKTGVDAVEKGQTEAALALGYTDSKAFLKMVFPQAFRHFMPGYKSSLVSLIKDTSIVGYIAVQDLTKISDIVRSRTYEPFFPLIVTAIIYFLLATVLIHVVKRMEIFIDPRHRKAEKILKGVKTK